MATHTHPPFGVVDAAVAVVAAVLIILATSLIREPQRQTVERDLRRRCRRCLSERWSGRLGVCVHGPRHLGRLPRPDVLSLDRHSLVAARVVGHRPSPVGKADHLFRTDLFRAMRDHRPAARGLVLPGRSWCLRCLEEADPGGRQMMTESAGRSARAAVVMGFALVSSACMHVSYRTCERVPEAPAYVVAARLSETGLFVASHPNQGSSGASPEVSPGVYRFTPAFELWSDGATKRRWIYLPPGSRIDTRDPDAWRFPTGTKLWKEFRRQRPSGRNSPVAEGRPCQSCLGPGLVRLARGRRRRRLSPPGAQAGRQRSCRTRCSRLHGLSRRHRQSGAGLFGDSTGRGIR